MTDEFKTISATSEGYYTEKRSKFLAFAHHVENHDEITLILAGYRKKYYDARHVCYAYMLGAERADFRANDDGEPSSTAGKPILGQINSNELTDILIVVVRYYGGVNLGRRQGKGRTDPVDSGSHEDGKRNCCSEGWHGCTDCYFQGCRC